MLGSTFFSIEFKGMLNSLDLDKNVRVIMFRYIGSKIRTSCSIREITNKFQNVKTVADAYGGLGTIGSMYKSNGYKVETCDALEFPHLFQVARIECNFIPKFTTLKNNLGINSIEKLLCIINEARDSDSWFVDEYCLKRRFFSVENGVKIAGAWRLIRHWNDNALLTRIEKAFIIASFLNSVDSVANTAGTYYAHLKNLDRKALRPFNLRLMDVTSGSEECFSHKGDALNVLAGKKFDVLYLDPPYNKRNYASYYHLPETLALLNEIDIPCYKKSGAPKIPHSGYESISKGANVEYIESLIGNIGWKYLILHYCDHAIIPLEILREKLSHSGSVEEHIINALGYTNVSAKRQVKHHVFVVTR